MITKAIESRSLNFMDSSNQGKEKPVCLILDEIDAFMEQSYINVDKLLNLLTKKKKKNTSEDVMDEEGPSNPGTYSSTVFKRPIILICNNLYSKNMKKIRDCCRTYQLRSNEDSILQRMKEIAHSENMKITADVLIQIVKSTNSDIRASLNILELIAKRENPTKEEILHFLSKVSIEKVETSYFSLLKEIFSGMNSRNNRNKSRGQ